MFFIAVYAKSKILKVNSYEQVQQIYATTTILHLNKIQVKILQK